jgi:hypothetical protein
MNGSSQLYDSAACILPLHAANGRPPFTYFMRRDEESLHCSASRCKGLEPLEGDEKRLNSASEDRCVQRSVSRGDLELLNPIIGVEFRRAPKAYGWTGWSIEHD